MKLEATMELAPSSAQTRKYLTFTLGNESFGIDVLKVREIIRLTTITLVPQMPAHVRGVINLRGKIIPVMDLRMRFGFPSAAHTAHTCIVVTLVTLPNGQPAPMGLMVDAVEEVLNLGAAEIEATPTFGSQVEAGYIIGMAKVKGAVKALLDIDRVIGGTMPEQPFQRLNQPN